MKILIAAGGSGGHLFPAQALAKELAPHASVMMAGHHLTKSPFFHGNFPSFDIVSATPKKPIRFLFSVCKGLVQAFRLISKNKIDVVVGFGSFHTFPVLLASALLRKKIILFEANCVLGKVNRLFAPVSKKVALQFPLNRAIKNGIFVPLLPWGRTFEVSKKEKALDYFGLKKDKFTILVFGGSQGAAFFNEIMPRVASLLCDVQIIHFTGKGKALYANENACVKEFETRMDLAYAAADLVICRSGASTVAELIRYGKPSLLIPFPFATEDHQRENALFLANMVRGAKLLDQKEALPDKIKEEIINLNLPQMEANLKAWNAGERVDLINLVLA